MIDKFIVPSLISMPDEMKFSDGLLFKLPADLGGAHKIRFYASIEKLGWHSIDYGHSMFIHRSEELGFVRFIGILPQGSKIVRGVGMPHPFSKSDFERYVESLVESEIKTKERIKDELSLLIHDLRRFSNSIYQNAVATKKAIYDGEGQEAALKIDNTLAAQAMLSIRTDILDITESNDVQLDETKVHVYRKFHKVVNSFKPGCSLKNIDINISGSSHSVTLGPDCAEIIAYILIDNALKYSPANHKISVSVLEANKYISVSVTSLGPLVEKDELELIFEKGYRSRAARKVEANGTGYGLYLAKSLVSRFKGKITAEQFGDTIRTSRGELRDCTFKVLFPITERHEKPIHTHQEKKGPPKQIKPLRKKREELAVKTSSKPVEVAPETSKKAVGPKSNPRMYWRKKKKKAAQEGSP